MTDKTFENGRNESTLLDKKDLERGKITLSSKTNHGYWTSKYSEEFSRWGTTTGLEK